MVEIWRKSTPPRSPCRGGCSPRRSAPACSSRSSSDPGSPPNVSRPATPGCNCWSTRTSSRCWLAVLILMFGPVSGAQFNPVVTAADWLLGRRTGTGIGGVHVAPYIGAQTVGAVAGALLANAMFDLPLVEISGTDRAGTGHGIGESVATAGLVALIFLLARTGLARPVRRGGRRLHRRRLLVHLVHLVREPRRHGRPDLHRHLRRDRPFVGSVLCRRADHRRGNRCRSGRHPVPEHEPQRSPRPGRSGE